jgi:hypothetical protein
LAASAENRRKRPDPSNSIRHELKGGNQRYSDQIAALVHESNKCHSPTRAGAWILDLGLATFWIMIRIQDLERLDRIWNQILDSEQDLDSGFWILDQESGFISGSDLELRDQDLESGFRTLDSGFSSGSESGSLSV